MPQFLENGAKEETWQNKNINSEIALGALESLCVETWNHFYSIYSAASILVMTVWPLDIGCNYFVFL